MRPLKELSPSPQLVALFLYASPVVSLLLLATLLFLTLTRLLKRQRSSSPQKQAKVATVEFDNYDSDSGAAKVFRRRAVYSDEEDGDPQYSEYSGISYLLLMSESCYI